MNFNSEDDSISQNSPGEWLTPQEAATVAGVSVRSIYQWVKRGKVESTGEDRSTRISRVSLENLKRQRSVVNVEGEVIETSHSQADSQDLGSNRQTSGGRPNQRPGSEIAALALREAHDRLQIQLAELQANWGKDQYRIGQLEEKARRADQVEAEAIKLRADYILLQELRRQEALTIGQLQEQVRQLQAAQAAPEQAQPVTITPAQEIAPEPAKRGFWQRLLGG